MISSALKPSWFNFPLERHCQTRLRRHCESTLERHCESPSSIIIHTGIPRAMWQSPHSELVVNQEGLFKVANKMDTLH
jgi:hypothetical protein